MAELKPCPFCWGEAEEKYLRRKMRYRLFNFPNITHYVYIKCKICGATTAVKETRENASDVWNKRTKPERPKGRWVWDVETHGDPMYGVDVDFGWRCSECKVWADEYGVDGDIYEEPPTNILHFCPNCSADMRGESE